MVDIQRDIMDKTSLNFKRLIVWNKKYKGAKLEHYLQGHLEVEQLRNYKLMAEYILFYTKQSETGLNDIMLDINNFKSLRDYSKSLQKEIGHTKKRIIDDIGQRADHYFRHSSSQWSLCTKETYQDIIETYKLHEWKELRAYEDLVKEYNRLRDEYENLRYTFNNQKKHHSIWNYDVAEKIGHATPKPIPLLENIILHSSDEGDLVLDCFMGSGSTGVACKKTNRRFIGIEKDKNNFNLSKERIEKA